MPTPAIQTLINDAQQVLNLDSISAVRSVVAVSLANANTGTPLNPNLTTQQLWNEFYQVVTRSKSDIESIIANQLMKFLYSPPAPGGVGSNGQVIFNDGGVLAGDAGLTYDKATDTLSVAGKIGLRTSLFATDSVFAVKTTSGKFDIRAFGGASVKINSDAAMGYNVATGNGHIFQIADADQMTLNATGLGVGASPSYRLHVSQSQVGETNIFVDNQQNDPAALSGLWLSAYGGTWKISVPRSATFVNPLIFKFGSTEMMRMTSVGDIVLAGGNTSANGVGITFPATQVASSDANTLDDYEEGTFTPTISAGSGTPTTVTVNSAGYTKIGRQVTVNIDFSIIDKGTANGVFLFSLPFAASSSFAPAGSFKESSVIGYMGPIYYVSTAYAGLVFYNDTVIWVNNYRVRGTYTYFV